MLLTYDMILSFQNLLCFFVIYDYVTMICNSIIWHVTVFFNLVMEGHMIDAYDYVTWDNVIGLEESRRF